MTFFTDDNATAYHNTALDAFDNTDYFLQIFSPGEAFWS